MTLTSSMGWVERATIHSRLLSFWWVLFYIDVVLRIISLAFFGVFDGVGFVVRALDVVAPVRGGGPVAG